MSGDRCEKCGGRLEHRKQGSTRGAFCTVCDWSVVTTYIDAKNLDPVLYKVFIRQADPENIKQVKEISEIAGVNFLDSRKMLKEADFLVFEGQAPDVWKVLDVLRTLSLAFDIVPPFPH